MPALDSEINPDIGTLKKYRGAIFLESCAEIFKTKFLHYVNEVLIEMVKISLKDTYLVGTNPTELQNEVSTCRKMYYDRETRVIVNQSVNEFYIWFLLKLMHYHRMSPYHWKFMQPYSKTRVLTLESS